MNALLAGLAPGTSPLAEERKAPAVKPPIQKVRYTHQAMSDMLIAEPMISQNELASRFGYSASWVSTILCSDVFQAFHAERRDLLVDPEIRTNLKLQFEGLLARSMEVLRAKLDKPPDEVTDQLALQTAKIASQSIGMGAPKVSIHETHVHLEELGTNLVGLLRRRKTEASVVSEVPAGPQGPGPTSALPSLPSPSSGDSPNV